MKRARWILGAGAVAIVAWLAWGAHLRPTAGAPQVAEVSSSSPLPAAGMDAGADPGPEQDWTDERRQHLSSLRDSQPDGAITLGFAGRLKPDRALRYRFDYYLALIGEASLADIRRLLRDDLQQQGLDPAVGAEVMAAFEKYLRLQQASAALAKSTTGTLAQQLQALRLLRSEILGESLAQAFYGADQAREDLEQAQLDITMDPALSKEEKRGRLDALQAKVLAEDPVLRQQAVAMQLEQMTQRLDQAGADPAQRYQQRAAIWGDAAAGRLATLDQQRETWQQRVESYRQASSALQQNQGMSLPQQQEALRQLQDQSFSPQEQIRLRAWLSSAAGAGGG